MYSQDLVNVKKFFCLKLGINKQIRGFFPQWDAILVINLMWVEFIWLIQRATRVHPPSQWPQSKTLHTIYNNIPEMGANFDF